jgi:hypothetical protein
MCQYRIDLIDQDDIYNAKRGETLTWTANANVNANVNLDKQ